MFATYKGDSQTSPKRQAENYVLVGGRMGDVRSIRPLNPDKAAQPPKVDKVDKCRACPAPEFTMSREQGSCDSFTSNLIPHRPKSS